MADISVCLSICLYVQLITGSQTRASLKIFRMQQAAQQSNAIDWGTLSAICRLGTFFSVFL